MPTAFISYASHPAEHAERVLQFAARLRKDGIESIIDREEESPDEGWDYWMMKQIRDANWVIIVCSATYRERFEHIAPPKDGRGVRFESAHIVRKLNRDGMVNHKFVPVFLTSEDAGHLPLMLDGYSHYPCYTTEGWRSLLYRLHGRKQVILPDVADSPELPTREIAGDFPASASNLDDGIAVPRQLPAPPLAFTGRELELAELTAYAGGAENGKSVIIALRGLGGVGKTALALVAADRMRNRYPDGQIYLDLRGASPNPRNSSEALAHIIRALRPKRRLTVDLDHLRGEFHNALRNKHVLLLMDNAANGDQVRPLLPPAGSLLLVTTRERFHLEGLHGIDLQELLLADAMQFLSVVCPRVGEYAGAIARLSGRFALALQSNAGTLAENPLLSPESFVTRLADERRRLARVEAAFTVSYEQLPEELRRSWRSLSVFPGSFDIKEAAVLWGISEDAAIDTLGRLHRSSMLEYDPVGGRTRMHDLARAFANSLISADDKNATAP